MCRTRGFISRKTVVLLGMVQFVYMQGYKQTDLFTCNGISRLLIPLHVKHTHHTCIYTLLPEDEPLSSKHADDTNKLKIKILI